jgi:hypothetical protein
MNLYISHSVGNEPMSGCLTALTVVLLLRYLRMPEARTDRAASGIGAALGFALLTKVSAVVLLPAIILSIGLRRRGVRRAAIVVAVAALISGWYYVRNVIHFGTPFVAGWDPSRVPWWQDPGFRTLGSFYRFGSVFTDPLYAGTRSFWDALYSTFWADGFMSGMITLDSGPPWNYTLMSAAICLAVVPTLAILSGIIRGWRNRCVRFGILCCASFVAALLDLYLTLPVYSTAKATYLLGLTPAFAILVAAGVAPLLCNRFVRSILFGLLTAWAVFSYAAFFVF